MMKLRASSFSAPLLVLLVLLAILQSTVVVVAGPLETCMIDCGPHGHCFDSECQCDSGYAGADCSFPYEQCPDHILQCYGTGSMCVKENIDNGEIDSSRQHLANGDSTRVPTYTCHCDTELNHHDAFLIEQCESPRTHHCEQDVHMSEYAFCTNGGTCQTIVRRGERHAGCHCPTGYEGKHCQYRKGTAPAFELSYNSYNVNTKQGGGALSGFVKFLIATMCLLLIAGFASIVYSNYKVKQEGAVKDLPNEDEEEMTDWGGNNGNGNTDKPSQQPIAIEADLTMDESADELDTIVDNAEEEDGVDVDKGELA